MKRKLDAVDGDDSKDDRATMVAATAATSARRAQVAVAVDSEQRTGMQTTSIAIDSLAQNASETSSTRANNDDNVAQDNRERDVSNSNNNNNNDNKDVDNEDVVETEEDLEFDRLQVCFRRHADRYTNSFELHVNYFFRKTC